MHARSGAPLLSGAVPTQRRCDESLRRRQRRRRTGDGALRHPRTGHLQVLDRCQRPEIRGGRQVLRGCVRRIVRQRPVVDQRHPAAVARRAGLAAVGDRRERHAEKPRARRGGFTRPVQPLPVAQPGRAQGRPDDPGLRHSANQSPRTVRRLVSQHQLFGAVALPARVGEGAPHPAADVPDDRRPAQ